MICRRSQVPPFTYQKYQNLKKASSPFRRPLEGWLLPILLSQRAQQIQNLAYLCRVLGHWRHPALRRDCKPRKKSTVSLFSSSKFRSPYKTCAVVTVYIILKSHLTILPNYCRGIRTNREGESGKGVKNDP